MASAHCPDTLEGTRGYENAHSGMHTVSGRVEMLLRKPLSNFMEKGTLWVTCSGDFGWGRGHPRERDIWFLHVGYMKPWKRIISSQSTGCCERRVVSRSCWLPPEDQCRRKAGRAQEGRRIRPAPAELRCGRTAGALSRPAAARQVCGGCTKGRGALLEAFVPSRCNPPLPLSSLTLEAGCLLGSVGELVSCRGHEKRGQWVDSLQHSNCRWKLPIWG